MHEPGTGTKEGESPEGVRGAGWRGPKREIGTSKIA